MLLPPREQVRDEIVHAPDVRGSAGPSAWGYKPEHVVLRGDQGVLGTLDWIRLAPTSGH